MKLVMTGLFLGVLSGCATTGTKVKCDAHLTRINPESQLSVALERPDSSAKANDLQPVSAIETAGEEP